MEFGEKFGKKKDNEVTLYTIAIGEIDPFATGMKAAAQEEALMFIQSLDGFVGFHPIFGKGTICMFWSEAFAKKARQELIDRGCPVGDNVTECYVPKSDLPPMQ